MERIKKLLKQKKGCCKKFFKFFKKDLKKLIPQLYLIGLLLSFILVLLYATFPSLVICSSFLGREFCTQTGIFTGLILSIPGYLIAGNILSGLGELQWYLSLLIVFITSLVFYYLLGLYIDKFKKADGTERIKLIVIGVFFFLLLFLIMFL